MKNLIKFFMVMAVLCMTACSQTFEDVSNNAKPQEKGRLVMNVGSRSRTIMPTVDTLKSNIKSATLTANNTEIRSWSGYNGDNVINQIKNDNNILLDVGTYNFEMKFCNENSDVILSGTIDNQEIKTGDNELTFDMQISTTGKGKISIELSREADSRINKIKAGLCKIAIGEAVENYEMKELTISSDTYTTCYSKDNVQAGQYIIKFEIYDATNKLLNTLTDVIEVIGGITTTHQITLDKINTQYYTITYNLGDGNWQNGFTPITKRNANTKVTLPTAENIKKENFIFADWYDNYGNIITEIPSGTTGNITVTAGWKTTADTVVAAINSLSGDGPHDIIVTGEITNATISDINTALSDSSAKVNLDLSKTSGLTSLGYYAFQGCKNLTSVTIPDSVSEIGQFAFAGCSSLTSVTIPDDVKSISNQAFGGCSSLTSVIIGNSVESIDGLAFLGCSSLTNFSVSENNANFSTSDDGKILYNHNEDKTTLIAYPSATDEVTIPAGVTTIGQSAFNGCTGLTSVTIPAGVTTIGDSVFYGCSSLKSVTIPAGVTSIGNSVFEDCKNLTSVTIPDSVTTIGMNAFYGCTGLTSVTIPAGVIEIWSGVFSGCSSLKSVTIPDSVTTIGSSAFSGCEKLASVTIGNSVTSIGMNAFNGCSSLTTVNYKGTEDEWSNKININDRNNGNNDLKNATINYNAITVTSDNVSTEISGLGEGSYTIIVTGEITSNTISDINTALKNNSNAKVNLDLSDSNGLRSLPSSAFSGCTNLISIIIPDSVTWIQNYAFTNCTNLVSIFIPDSVSRIDSDVFNGCSKLKEITIPKNTKTISSYIFWDCSNLTSITIPDGVTSIGNYAFRNCINLTEITIPDSVETIGESAFAGCINLIEVSLPGSMKELKASTFSGCSNLKKLEIPASVTSIVSYAFKDCVNLTEFIVDQNNPNFSTLESGKILCDGNGKKLISYPSANGSVTIPYGITTIGDDAFKNCINLTEITIPDSVIEIGSYAFNGCSSLTSVTFAENSKLTTIGQSAFYDCDSLTSVTIPGSVTTIGQSAFLNCDSLTSVTFADNSRLTTIGESAFSSCKSLERVTIPDSVTTIGQSAFNYCHNLTSIIIPDGVTLIDDYTFFNCSSLTSIEIPSSVNSIEWNAFGSCNLLTTVNYRGTQAQWEQIEIDSTNYKLTSATINYEYTGE